jgi:hypothetical protein
MADANGSWTPCAALHEAATGSGSAGHGEFAQRYELEPRSWIPFSLSCQQGSTGGSNAGSRESTSVHERYDSPVARQIEQQPERGRAPPHELAQPKRGWVERCRCRRNPPGIALQCSAATQMERQAHMGSEPRKTQPTDARMCVSEANRTHLVLSGTQNMAFGPYLAANNRIPISLMAGERPMHRWMHCRRHERAESPKDHNPPRGQQAGAAAPTEGDDPRPITQHTYP